MIKAKRLHAWADAIIQAHSTFMSTASWLSEQLRKVVCSHSRLMVKNLPPRGSHQQMTQEPPLARPAGAPG